MSKKYKGAMKKVFPIAQDLVTWILPPNLNLWRKSETTFPSDYKITISRIKNQTADFVK